MSNNTTNVLASGIEIIGSIRFTNDMHIDGKIEGQILSESGKVTIGEQADIKGDINAGDVHVYGRVNGNIRSNRCHLKDHAVITGDITTAVLSLDECPRLSRHAGLG